MNNSELCLQECRISTATVDEHVLDIMDLWERISNGDDDDIDFGDLTPGDLDLIRLALRHAVGACTVRLMFLLAQNN